MPDGEGIDLDLNLGAGNSQQVLQNLANVAALLQKNLIAVAGSVDQVGRSAKAIASQFVGGGGGTGIGAGMAMGTRQGAFPDMRVPGMGSLGFTHGNAEKKGHGWGALPRYAAPFAAIYGAQHIAGGAANTINAMNNPTFTSGQQTRHAAESLPVVGGLIASFNKLGDALNGVTEGFQNLELRLREVRNVMGAQAERNMSMQTMEQQHFGTFAIAQARRNRAEMEGGENQRKQAAYEQLTEGVDFGSIAGQREYAHRERVMPIMAQKRELEIQQEAERMKMEFMKKQEGTALAQFQQASAGMGTGNLDPSVERRKKAQDRLKKGVSGGVNQFMSDVFGAATGSTSAEDLTHAEGLAEKMMQAQKAAEALQRAQQANAGVIEAENRLKEIGVQIAQKEVDIQKSKLGILQDQIGETQGLVRGFGGLQAPEKEAALMAAQQMKEQGVGSLSEDQRALLQQAGAGRHLQQAMENDALKDDRTKQFTDIFGANSDLRGMQKQAAQINANLQVDVQMNEERAADLLVSRISKVLERAFAMIEAKMGIKIAEGKTQIGLGNVTSGR